MGQRFSVLASWKLHRYDASRVGLLTPRCRHPLTVAHLPIFFLSVRLAHNVYGPHDENFYKLLREHREEYTAIYHSEPSRKLGVGSPGDVINLTLLGRRERLQYSLQNNLT